MLCLSRSQLEEIALEITQKYKRDWVPERYLLYRIEPLKLAKSVGVFVDFQKIARTMGALGLTSPNEMCVTILDENDEEAMYYLDGNTILIEKGFLTKPELLGKMNYTICHEIAHQVIYKRYPEYYMEASHLDRLVNGKREISDWEEWRADALGAALLLPREVVEESMFWHGLGSKMKVLSQKNSAYKYESFCQMQEYLEVSKSALSFRMEHLGLLERNALFSERGVKIHGRTATAGPNCR